MKRHEAPRALSGAVAALALLAFAGAPAHAGSLTVRDRGNAWTVNDDPQADGGDFLLKHLVNGTRPDEGFGRNGQTAFTLGAANDPPASIRVDATHRIWMVGASLAGNQPQPVVARFTADGNPDLRWGVQGKVQLTPGGVAVKPNDLLPLADGSVLVAGEVAGVAVPRAVVFHLNANGSLDRDFGAGGLWQRAGEGDTSIATSLAANTDGVIAVAVSVHGAKPGAELWRLSDAAPAVIQSKPSDDTSDGEDLRVAWFGDRWVFSYGGGPTGIVPPALLTARAQPPAAAAAASDPGAGGFSPFADEAAAAAPAAPSDDDLPWTWIAIAALLLAAIAGVFVMRARKPKTVLRQPPRH
jgi:hypothetical protein